MIMINSRGPAIAARGRHPCRITHMTTSFNLKVLKSRIIESRICCHLEKEKGQGLFYALSLSLVYSIATWSRMSHVYLEILNLPHC